MQRLIIGFIILAYIQGFSQTYDPQAAAAYARRWCNDINSNYNYYGLDQYGGDCANFVSQCLKAGGMDLSLGAYGVPGGTGEVDNKGCIKGAKELVMHLEKYQNVTPRVSTLGYSPPTHHDVGDPMFTLNLSNVPNHAYICSSLNSNARQLHSAHTEDRCDDNMADVFGSNARLIYFHIKSAYPDHCDNCQKNPERGEEEIDCGGPCPPCERAPDQKHITTATNNLPSEVRAVSKITAGNAAVKVLPGQDVSFITAGTIELLPGFEVQAGGNFDTQIKGNILGVTATCGKFCETLQTKNYYVRYQDPCFYVDGVTTCAVKMEYKVYRKVFGSNNFIQIHRDVTYVTRAGIVELWDLVTGEENAYLKPGYWHQHYIEMWVYTCYGEWIYYYPFWFIVETLKDKSFGMDLESERTEDSDILSSLSSDNIMLQNENTAPTFSILPNPNPGTFQLETTFPLTNIANLKITNLLGAPVYESQNLSSNTIQLPTSATGTFFVVIMLKDGSQLTQKMMIQR